MEQKENILQMAETMTVKDIRMGLKLSHSTVYRILHEMGYYSSEEKDKRREAIWRVREAEKIAAAQRELDERRAAIRKLPTRVKPVAKMATNEEEPKPFVRVKGEYSNNGSIQTTQKYAI